jgi:hypothetical protein
MSDDISGSYSGIIESIEEIAYGNDYGPLQKVLDEAFLQASHGKGKQCHANGKPFIEQPIMTELRLLGPAGSVQQVRKKVLEAMNCKDDERAVEDLLGAIVYTAAMVIARRDKR